MRMTNDSLTVGTLDGDLLRTFLAIAETRSFTEGAKRIFRSQSAASLQIKKLETLLGRPVFERRGRGLVLTAAGESLRPAAQRIVDMLDRTLVDIRDAGLRGRLRVGIPDEYGGALLPELLARFGRTHPQVDLVVQCAFSAGFPGDLAQGDLDIAVYDAEEVEPTSILLRRHRRVWAASKRHVVEDRDPVPVAVFDQACSWREKAIEALEESGRRYRIAFSSESTAGVTAAIDAGIAVGLVPETVLSGDHRILGDREGFPAVPDSLLLLDVRPGTDPDLAAAMVDAIRAAFDTPAALTGL